MRTLWVLVVAVMAVLLGTCGTTPRSCRTLPPLPRVAACAAPEGGWGQGGNGAVADGYAVTLAGRVTAAADGLPPDGCFESGALVGNLPRPTDASIMWWFRAADASGKAWTVGVLASQLQRPVAVGQLVQADYQWSARGFSPTLGRLEVRDGGGALLFWMAQGGDIPDLALPVEVAQLRRGAARCQEREHCGAWIGHDLVVSTGAAETTLRYGRESVLGDLRLVHAGYDLASAFTGCADWYVASIVVAAVPALPSATSKPASPRTSAAAPLAQLAPRTAHGDGPCPGAASGRPHLLRRDHPVLGFALRHEPGESR